jgi:hypothetical protein
MATKRKASASGFLFCRRQTDSESAGVDYDGLSIHLPMSGAEPTLKGPRMSAAFGRRFLLLRSFPAHTDGRCRPYSERNASTGLTEAA